eukprot:g35148.t1
MVDAVMVYTGGHYAMNWLPQAMVPLTGIVMPGPETIRDIQLRDFSDHILRQNANSLWMHRLRLPRRRVTATVLIIHSKHPVLLNRVRVPLIHLSSVTAGCSECNHSAISTDLGVKLKIIGVGRGLERAATDCLAADQFINDHETPHAESVTVVAWTGYMTVDDWSHDTVGFGPSHSGN